MLARIARVAVVGIAVALAGCGTLLRNPVPPPLVTVAAIPNMPDVRAWAGQPAPAMERDLADSFRQESRAEFPRDANGVIHYAHLALSGGGANGAFGAGFLNGWTSTGTRPVFKTVTGVSTGALMAPFAFLGPSYDTALREFYTTTSSRDIFIVGSLFSLGGAGAVRRGAGRHRPAGRADRAARGRRTRAARRRGARARAPAVHRHRRSRRAALRRVEHGAHRVEQAARRRSTSSGR